MCHFCCTAILASYEKVNGQEVKFNNDAARQTYNVAVAKADGNRKGLREARNAQRSEARSAD